MADDVQSSAPESNPDKTPETPQYTLAVRKAAARAAVSASKKTGRPVDPRVAELAKS